MSQPSSSAASSSAAPSSAAGDNRKSKASKSQPESDLADAVAPKVELDTVRVVCRGNGDLQLDYSASRSPYSNRLASKLLKKKVPPGKWKHYTCGEGKVAEFVTSGGKKLGAPKLVHAFEIMLVVADKKVQKILVRNLVDAEEQQVKPSKRRATNNPEKASSSKEEKGVLATEKSKEDRHKTNGKTASNDSKGFFGGKSLMNYDDVTVTKEEEIAGKYDGPVAKKGLPPRGSQAGASKPLSLPKREPGKPPNWARVHAEGGDAASVAAKLWGGDKKAVAKRPAHEWLTPSTTAETQLKVKLKDMNGKLHEQRMEENEKRLTRRGKKVDGPTWIENLMKVAAQKCPDHATPLCQMIQVFTHHDYLKLKHANLDAAKKMVDKVVDLLFNIRKKGKGELHKFACELLDRLGYKELDTVQVGGATRKAMSELLGKFSDPKGSPSTQAMLITQELSASMGAEFGMMKSEGNEGKKIEALNLFKDTLAAARGSRAYTQCNAKQRDEFNSILDTLESRVHSYVNQSQIPPEKMKR